MGPRAASAIGPEPERRRRGGAGTGWPRGCAAAGTGAEVEVRQLVTAMRHLEPTRETRRAGAGLPAGQGVAGFDIAGAEDGFPPAWFLGRSTAAAKQAYYTIHAGEADGVASIWEAVQVCGANRIGHGVAIMEDIRLRRRRRADLGGWRATCSTSGSRSSCAPRRTCRPAGRLPGGAPVPDRSTTWLPRHGQLRQPADERDHAEPGARAGVRGVRLWPGGIRWFALNAASSVFAPYGTRMELAERIIAG